MAKRPFTFTPKAPANNGHLRQAQSPSEILAGISAGEWPAERDKIVEINARQAFSQLPAYQMSAPVTVPGRDAEGNGYTAFHHGLRVRDRVALDLLAASVSARIAQKGVLGALTAIPSEPAEMQAMVRQALQLAEVFVAETHMLTENDMDTLRGKLADRLDDEYRAAHATKGSFTTRVVEEQ